ncbi:11615_t:CDS:2 [Entrophospora sp. SA101]|nr:13597_t:CDS:2 [Entrophospora sp. SA101]CAJ0762680.1 11615_t:CDS:2 [Entrophospora sp. SA101]
MKRFITHQITTKYCNNSNKYIRRSYNASNKLFDTAVSEHKNDSSLFVSEPKKKVEADRDLILEVLHTAPNQHSTPTKPLTAQEQSKLLMSSIQKAEFVDSLFATRFEHIALIKLQGPFVPLNLNYVAKTLVHLQKLGLMSIVVLDNDEWRELMREGPSSFVKLRHWMMENATDVSQAIENCGGRATPIYNGIFSLKNTNRNSNGFLSTNTKIDVSLSWLQSTLKLGQIPMILPIALDEQSIQKTLSPNDGMIALTKALSNLPENNSLNIKNPKLEPMRIIVINEEGGVPAEDRKGSHVFINIQQEYDDIKESYKVNPQWKLTHPTGLENFEMIKSCLEICPSTTSAIMVPSFSPTGLISNLITDKPLFSSSLPLNARTTPSTSTTVIRYGLHVYYHHSLSNINIPSLRSLIESSFDRKLDVDEYVKRLKKCSREIIVAGDYQGAAIVTIEDCGIAYLDKFAVAPSTQGIGVADILWKQLQLRSHGNLKVPGTNWIMFWHGDEAINTLDKCIKICQKVPVSFYPRRLPIGKKSHEKY